MVESSSPVQGRHAAVSFAQRDGRTEFRLVFSEGPNVELLETWFTHPLTHQPLKSTRGKTADSKDTGTFGWTNAVRALSLLLIRHKLSAFRDNTCNRMAITAGISGPRGSLAESLGYAISKEPLWLQEMFGLDSKGNSILKRLLKRSNPELKRPGPTSVSVNESIVRPQSISIYVGSLPVEDEAELQALLFGLERTARWICGDHRLSCGVTGYEGYRICTSLTYAEDLPCRYSQKRGLSDLFKKHRRTFFDGI